MVSIQDPFLMIERSIRKFKRFVSLAEQAYDLAYAPTSHMRMQARKMYFTRYPSPKHLILGVFLFPLASSMVFTSIPIFLSLKIGASSSLIFSILLIKSITILIGYTIIRNHKQKEGLSLIRTASILRSFFPILILVSGVLPFHISLTLSSLALAIAGFAWPYFSVPSMVLWMETAPKGTAGLYRACVTLGVALGSLFGGFIPSFYGYEALFVLSATVFWVSLFLFTSSARGRW
jgi:predicted MFS family arabinose efflux permease